MKKRSHPIFADLRTPKYRKRVVQSKKRYRRKNRDNSKG